MAVKVHVIEAAWTEYRDSLQHIRQVVFVDEQQVPQDEEWDGLDEDSLHFLAVTQMGHYIGCARLLPSGQIGRMAVLKEHRGTGAGALLLQAAVDGAKQQGFDRVFLHAQSYASEFYRKGGFVAYGNEFMEAGIAHIAMELKLPLQFPGGDLSDAQVSQPLIRPQDPEGADLPDSAPQQFSGLAEALDALDQVAGFARRKLDLLHPNLDQELFERADFLQLISDLARSAPLVEVRILLMDSKMAVDRGHQLVELARRLDDKIKIRLFSERITDETSAFMCVDQSSYWVLPNWREMEGISDLNNRVMVGRLRDSFNQAWAKSQIDPQLRRLSL